MKYIAKVKGEEYEIEIERDNEIVVNGATYAIDFSQLSDPGTLSVLINNRSIAALVDESNEYWDVLIRGELYTVEVQEERAYRLSQARATLKGNDELAVRSPMPGLILKILVKEGMPVKSGDKVVILESMKMENELRAPRDGVVHHIQVAAGDSVEKNQTLVVIGDHVGDDSALDNISAVA
jgi:biotin carboxyl carrier protein